MLQILGRHTAAIVNSASKKKFFSLNNSSFIRYYGQNLTNHETTSKIINNNKVSLSSLVTHEFHISILDGTASKESYLRFLGIDLQYMIFISKEWFKWSQTNLPNNDKHLCLRRSKREGELINQIENELNAHSWQYDDHSEILNQYFTHLQQPNFHKFLVAILPCYISFYLARENSMDSNNNPYLTFVDKQYYTSRALNNILDSAKRNSFMNDDTIDDLSNIFAKSIKFEKDILDQAVKYKSVNNKTQSLVR